MTTLHHNKLHSIDEIVAHLDKYNVLIWDFDGVIKESVPIKEDIFVSLFPHYSLHQQSQIRQHHRQYSGVSRYKKIPYYHSVGHTYPPSDISLQRYLNTFSDRVVSSVISCDYVAGFSDNILPYLHSKKSYLVSATPYSELKHILTALGLLDLFISFHGSPASKLDIFTVLSNKIDVNTSIYIGDSFSDYHSATSAGLDFLYRKHHLNSFDSLPHDIHFFDDFS